VTAIPFYGADDPAALDVLVRVGVFTRLSLGA
jgi:hypothetical protein